MVDLHYLFEDRKEAGRKLAQRLLPRRIGKETMVLALSPGGVMVGSEIASAFHLPLELFILNKLSVPGNPERTFGAVTEGGKIFLDSEVVTRYEIPDNYIQQAILSQKRKIQDHQRLYSEKRTRPNFQSKEIIVTDDGIQSGATLLAALQTLRARGVEKVTTAIPVAPEELVEKIKNASDEAIILHALPFFSTLSSYYHRFDPLSHDEVIAIMQKTNAGKKAA
jgi:predicted phosphoribosyltransferase